MNKSARAIIIAATAIVAGVAFFISAAGAAELLAVGQRNCPYCKAWEIEVGSVYAKTNEGKLAPLRRIRIDELASAAYAFNEPVIYAPTFVLLNGETEIGRITGYSDASMFWGLLNVLLRKGEPDAPTATKKVGNRSSKSDG